MKIIFEFVSRILIHRGIGLHSVSPSLIAAVISLKLSSNLNDVTTSPILSYR